MKDSPLNLDAIDPLPGIQGLNQIHVNVLSIKIAEHCVNLVPLSAEAQAWSCLAKLGSNGPGVALDRVHVDTAHIHIFSIVTTSNEDELIVEVGEARRSSLVRRCRFPYWPKILPSVVKVDQAIHWGSLGIIVSYQIEVIPDLQGPVVLINELFATINCLDFPCFDVVSVEPLTIWEVKWSSVRLIMRIWTLGSILPPTSPHSVLILLILRYFMLVFGIWIFALTLRFLRTFLFGIAILLILWRFLGEFVNRFIRGFDY